MRLGEWLDTHAISIEFQNLPSYRRRKNRVILSFRDQAGEVQTVGGTTLYGVVTRAESRLRIDPMPPSGAAAGTRAVAPMLCKSRGYPLVSV